MSLSRRAVHIAALGAFAVAGTAYAQSQSGHSDPPTQKPVTAAASPNAKARYGVLRRAQVARDASTLHRDSFAVKQDGINVDLARAIGPASARIPAWLVPSSSGLCLFAQLPASASASGGCSTVQDFEAGYATTSFPQGGGVTYVVGVVPDGVTAVTFHHSDGSDQQVAAAANGFEATVDDTTTSVSYVDPSTNETITAPVTTST